MAACDYYSCDACGKKTFYDANLTYGNDLNGDPFHNKPWPDGDVGGMAVICKKCAETHTIMILFDPDKPEKEKEDDD